MTKSLTIDSFSVASSEEVVQLIPMIHRELVGLSHLYPEFRNWFSQKVVPGIFTGERSLLVELREDSIAGVAIIKDDGVEKKLCCLRVSTEFQKKGGVGYRLFERSMEELDTRYPLLSVSEDRFSEFRRIFNHFGYEKAWEYPELYRLGKVELSFNGLLLPIDRDESRPYQNAKIRSAPIYRASVV
ncbi:hypothetical protein GALL_474600 [mine drainage metagenome]|uniref:N-acetyltransferase domain-containing protein n=1 Tax=mine drainage metagenome TaxID=410659 RepID=A0A1J5Q4V6_9ZZZZ